MTVTFVSNYLTHHQQPFCERMAELTDGGFTFISTTPMEKERLAMGWSQTAVPSYELPAYQNAALSAQAAKKVTESDAVILGAAGDEWARLRLSGGKLTFYYRERLYKNGVWRAFGPDSVRLRSEYRRLRQKPVYMLCAGAYLPYDLSLLGAFRKRCLRWGYFPAVGDGDWNRLRGLKEQNPKPRLLWAGRMPDWKHPEAAVLLARQLRAAGFDFELRIIGGGERENALRTMISEAALEDRVSLCGVKTPAEVRAEMERADILLATSDFHEGWGAVVNEGMSAGCAVAASHAMGSVPFLIRDGENGRIYPYGRQEQLFGCVAELLRDRSLCRRLGENACRTVAQTWNPDTAARRLLTLSETLMKDPEAAPPYSEGPCSRAEILKNSWRR